MSPLQVTLGTSRPQTCRQPVHGPWSTAGPGSPLPPRWARRSGPCSARGASVAEAARGVLRAAAPPHHEHCGRGDEGGGPLAAERHSFAPRAACAHPLVSRGEAPGAEPEPEPLLLGGAQGCRAESRSWRPWGGCPGRPGGAVGSRHPGRRVSASVSTGCPPCVRLRPHSLRTRTAATDSGLDSAGAVCSDLFLDRATSCSPGSLGVTHGGDGRWGVTRRGRLWTW